MPQFNPERHCGARTKAGTPCTHPKGFRTNHLGSGRCYLHGGKSTGPRTVDGKQRSRMNAKTHGLYGQILSGNAATRYRKTLEHDPASILQDSFYLIHAKVMGVLENDVKFSKQAQIVLQACEILVDNGELEPEFYDELRLLLSRMDVEKLSRILNSTVNLANASVFLNRMGNLQKQLAIAMGFIRTVLRVTSDETVRELAIAAISEMKLDAGLPVEEIDELLQFLKETAEIKEIDKDEAQEVGEEA